jgi:hypothetical protein
MSRVEKREARVELVLKAKLEYIRLDRNLFVYRLMRSTESRNETGSMKMITAYGTTGPVMPDDCVTTGFVDQTNLERMTAGMGYRDTEHFMASEDAMPLVRKDGFNILKRRVDLREPQPFEVIKADPKAVERISPRVEQAWP